MSADNDRTLRNVLEKLELLTGERADGNRRAVLISELNGAIQDLSDANAVVKKAVRELTAQFNQSSASIKEEMLVRADENSALAQIITTLKAQIGSNKAQIQETQRALATKTMAMAEHITTLAASVNSNSAGIVEEKRVRVTQNEALAQSIQTLTATVTSNNNSLTAAIQNEQTARVNGDSANAQSIQTLTSTVNGNTSSITTLTNTTASINGALTASWSVQGNIDGAGGGLRLTGIKKSDGTGATYNLIIDANTTINGSLLVNGTINVNSNGTSPIAPNAISEADVGFGNGSASVWVTSKSADDVYLAIASYAGGEVSAVVNNVGSLQIRKGGSPIGNAAPISGFVISGVVGYAPGPVFANYQTGSVTTMAKVVAGAAGTSINITCSTGLSAPVALYVVRLAR